MSILESILIQIAESVSIDFLTALASTLQKKLAASAAAPAVPPASAPSA